MQVERRERIASDRAHPAVRVGDLDAEEDVEDPGEDGVADKRLRHGIASPWIVPLKREPMTRSSPASQPVDERARAPRVGYVLVGVAHDDELAARVGEPGEVRAAVAARVLADHVAPCSAATSAERSVEPLSTTITSPARPDGGCPRSAWSTTLPTASSSFRHGTTTEISGTSVMRRE